MSKIEFEFLEYGKSKENIRFHVVQKSPIISDNDVQDYINQTKLSNDLTLSLVYSFVNIRRAYLLIRRELRTEQELGSKVSRPFEQRFIVVIPSERKSFVVSLVNRIYDYAVNRKLPYEVDSDNQLQFTVSIEYFNLFVAIMVELINGNQVQIPFDGEWKDAENIIQAIIAVLGFDGSLSTVEPTFSYGLMNEVGDPNIIFTPPYVNTTLAGRALISVEGNNESVVLSYLTERIRQLGHEIEPIKEMFVAYASLVKRYRPEEITRDLLELHFTGNEKLWLVFEQNKLKQVNPELLQKLCKYAVDRLLEADAIPDLLEWVYLAEKEPTYGGLFWKHPKLQDENKLASIGSSLLSDFLSNEEKSMEAISIVQTRILQRLTAEPKEEHPNLKLAWKYREGESIDSQKVQKELKNILDWVANGGVANLNEALKNAVIENRSNEFDYLLENHQEDIAKLNLKGLLDSVFEQNKLKQVNPELLQKLCKYAVDRLLEADAIPDLLEWVYLAEKEPTYGGLFWKHPKLDEEKLSLIGSSLLSDFLSNEEKSMDAISIVQTRILQRLTAEPKEEPRNLKLAWTYRDGTEEELKNILDWVANGGVANLNEALKNAVIENRSNEFDYLLVNHKEDIAKLNLKGLLDSVFEQNKLKQVNPELLQKLCKYAVDRLLEADAIPDLLEWVYLAEKEPTYGGLFWKHPKLQDENKLASIGSSLLSDFLSNEEKSMEAISIVQTRILRRLTAEPKEEPRNLKLAWTYRKGKSSDPKKVQKELKNILRWDEGDVDVDSALKNAVTENCPNEFKYLLKILEISKTDYLKTKISSLIRLTEGHAYFDEVMQSLLNHPTGLVKLIETLVDDKNIPADTIKNCFKFISTDEMDKVIKDISLKSNTRFIHLIKNALFKDEKPVIEYFLEHWKDTKDYDDISSSIDLLTLYFNKGDNTPLSEHSYVILRYITDNSKIKAYSKIKAKAQTIRADQLDQCIGSFLKHYNNKEDYSKFTEEVNYPITYYIINRNLEDRGKHGNKITSSTEDKIKSILDSFDTPEKKIKFEQYCNEKNLNSIPWRKTLAERVPLYVKQILWVVVAIIVVIILIILIWVFILDM